MNYSNKKALITGATGLIGKELIKPLKELGFEIYGITIDNNNPDNDIHWIQGNLFEESFIKETMEKFRPKYLLNLAWITTGDYLESDINYKFLDAGKNLIKYFKMNGGKRAVYAGTCFEYKFRNNAIKETDELDSNKTTYTKCKNELKEYTENFCQLNNISFGYGRIFYVFGKNENKTRLTGAIIDKLSRNEEVTINSGNLIKDYMYTKDIAGAFAKFLDSDVQGVVNICTGKGIAIKDYALKLATLLQKPELIIIKNESTTQPPIIVGDNTRLIEEVGYNIKYSLEEAFKEII